MNFEAPWWLPGGHAQTIWSSIGAKAGTALAFQRERWEAPDGDFVDVDFLASTGSQANAPTHPLLVLFHGLEGSSASHYAQAFAHVCQARGWQLAVPHFRGCSGELNRAPRAYHSGDFAEIDWLLARFAQRQSADGAPSAARSAALWAVGVSLGGNALLRWAGEMGVAARARVDAVAAICAPLDLTASGQALGRGINRQVYTRVFLRTMVPKALAKLAQFPGLFDRARLLAVRDLHAFDDVFTAPLHGFASADDYWRRASAKPGLAAVKVPALLLNACNDPFVPVSSLPQAAEISPQVTLWQPAQGGHVGFAQGRWPGQVQAMPHAVATWLAAQCMRVT